MCLVTTEITANDVLLQDEDKKHDRRTVSPLANPVLGETFIIQQQD